MLMQALRAWSFGKVLLACVALFLLSVVVMVGWFLFQARGFFFNEEGAGIGAVSIGINTVMLVIPVVPPMILIVAWLVARRATPV
jgi:hypothetical protein